MRLHIVCPPLHEGRPQALIYKDVITHALNKFGIENVHLIANHDPQPAYNGIYDPGLLITNASRTLTEAYNLVGPNDPVLFVEAWNPAVLALRQAFFLAGRTCNFYGILHGASGVAGDYLEGQAWARRLENDMSYVYKKIFVATDYFKKCLSEWSCPIEVTGLPIPKDCVVGEKEKIVVFNHRWTADKRPEIFVEVAEQLPDDWSAVVLTPNDLVVTHRRITVVRCANRAEYTKALSRAAIVFSSAILETFGYAMLEGHLSGAITVAPLSAAYIEEPWIMMHYKPGSPTRAVNAVMEAIDHFNNKKQLPSLLFKDASEAILNSIAKENQ